MPLLSYVDFGDAGDDVGINAGARYNVTEMFSLGVSGAWTDDGSSYGTRLLGMPHAGECLPVLL